MLKFFQKCLESKQDNKFDIFDMHTKEKIGEAPTKDCSIALIFNDIKNNNQYRSYTINEKNNTTAIWFGDAYDVDQHIRENLSNFRNSK